ncbi:histone-lysine N-methyltransferase SETMAR-like [Galleria mellonella]|uniref:Histone-lysine N-methyltransferase SETMAR-like n=1 Tax=Galleria mellonella TaxID=7137 RepID=A0ABM3MPQ0_GALME|nr:histone-lysine N-methyltransferase SETMAR-like [Galleria mellonella]
MTPRLFPLFNEFKRGNTNLTDDVHEGRPSTATTEDNISVVRHMIETDKRVTYQQIRASLGIGMSQVHKILHEHLAVRKLCARWIPHNLTEAQKLRRVDWCNEMHERFNEGNSNSVFDIVTGDESWIYCYDPETKRQSAQWVFPSEELPTKMRDRSVGKKMVASFFGRTGHYATIVLEDRKTVTAEWYSNNCLPRVLEKVREKRTRSRILLHHDNASSHTARQTIDYLVTSDVELLGHPPYSPDLAPCDIYLFRKIKEKLRGKRFMDAEEAVATFRKAAEEIPKDEWAKCFSQWFYRMQRCIDVNGHYFEKIK